MKDDSLYERRCKAAIAARIKNSLDPLYAVKRFIRKFRVVGNCWEWHGGRNEHRYGVFWFRGRLNKAHRVAWILINGEIPEGLDVLHHCDNPPCLKPSHLFLGTAKVNGEDAAKKGRMPRGSRHHFAKLTEEQVKEIRDQYKKWSKNHVALSVKYGISVITVRHILYRRGWKHV